MTELRILAPVVVDYYAVPGASLRDPTAYAGFWAKQQSDLDELLVELAPKAPEDGTIPAPIVVLEHTRPASSLNLYRTISDYGAERMPHVLTGALRPAHLPGEFTGATDVLHTGVSEISFRLYDHGLMLVELLANVDPALTAPADELPARLDELRDQAVAMGERVAREVVSRYLDPMLTMFRRADRDDQILAAATPADDPVTTEFGEALWVTRSLILDPARPDAETTVRHWVKDVVSAADDRPPADRLLDGEIHHLVRWLNYLFLDRHGAGGRMLPGDPFEDQWDALRYAQVFYGMLDRIDTRLSKILADSAAANSRWELDQLKDKLLGLSQRAELIIMERQDLSKYLKRSVRVEMDAILDFWDYETLLEQPVRFKIETCDRRLAELAARRTARSAMFTDLILLGIAMTSILGTALAVTDFGRSIASDPDMAVYDLGRSSAVEWFASQSADTILIASGMVSILLVIIYLFFRRDGRS
ncbi:hypothetical protein ACWDV4_20380 [Micromonospora sp. NPDC003197]